MKTSEKILGAILILLYASAMSLGFAKATVEAKMLERQLTACTGYVMELTPGCDTDMDCGY